MAYRCILNLKEECDGCGRCQYKDERPMIYDGRYSVNWDDIGPVHDPMDWEEC